MNLWEKQATFSYNLARLIQEINSHKCHAVVGEVERTPEQAALYFQQGKGIRDSLHCKKLAADIHLFSEEGIYLQDFKSYEPFGIFWEGLHPNNRWGGRFKDLVDSCHFEMQDI